MKLDSSLLVCSELAAIAQNLCICMHNTRGPRSEYGKRLDNEARRATKRIAKELMERAARNPCHFL